MAEDKKETSEVKEEDKKETAPKKKKKKKRERNSNITLNLVIKSPTLPKAI